MTVQQVLFSTYGGISLELTHADSDESPTDSSSPITFSGVSFGDADTDRDIIVFFSGVFGLTDGSLSVDSITVGGDSATIIAESYDVIGGDGRTVCGVLARVRKPTGTSGTIAITYSGGGTFQSRAQAISVYKMTGHEDGVQHDTANDVDDPTSMSIDIPAGGVVVAGSSGYLSSGPGTCTWTNADEDVDDTVDTFLGYSTASKKYDSEQTSLSVSGDWSATLTGAAGVAASWGP